ncbi:ncs-5 [Pristionchus pacificus]|uniref:Ncs-5 n=1 Tax=Pristionchus pacificus TaxID=54126 RepID=A0A2A6CG28_PRIPA|nr:ncs-5 [Pristionchus pacificus]|eukprot:PDM77162.1 ncs-5 [Pristionchus pacificus]
MFLQFSELDAEDPAEKWESTLQPPSISQITASTKFSPRWIKYFYARFKNECPTGRMREADFRRIICCVIDSNQVSDPYITRLFCAFSSDPTDKVITFQDIVDRLTFLSEGTPEVQAEWTVRLITGRGDDNFQYPEFATFVSSVFALGDAHERMKRNTEKETARQRAMTIFKELDRDNDGVATKTDLARFFRAIQEADNCPV